MKSYVGIKRRKFLLVWKVESEKACLWEGKKEKGRGGYQSQQIDHTCREEEGRSGERGGCHLGGAGSRVRKEEGDC